MRAALYVALIASMLSGCATLPTDYYTNPSSAGYTEPHFIVKCENCQRAFRCSQKDYDYNRGRGICPYCGLMQSLSRGQAAYNYDTDQANAIAAQQAAANMSAQLSNAMTQQQAIDQQQTQAIWGLVRKKRVEGTVTPNALGGYDFKGKLDE